MNLFKQTATAPARTPWDFQNEAIDSIFAHFSKHETNPIVVAPTGAGKSLILAEFIRRAHLAYPGTRFIVLSHVAELLKQDAQAILGQWPDCNLTFYSDSIGQKDLTGDVIVAGIQSIYKKALHIPLPIPALIMIDEAHLISSKDGSMYRKFLDDMAIVNPHIKYIGLTATPFRTGTGYLHKGENALFGDICYEIGILDLINRGFLTPVFTPTMQTRMETSGVDIVNGDFVQRQLEKRVDVDEITVACVDEIMQHGQDRKKWLIFTAGIQHCEHVRDEIRRRGISCEMVTGKTPTSERNDIVNRHKNGDLRCIVNVGVFTTGFDNPAIDLIAFMRPTRSPVLYIQMMGRAMRTYPGKTDAICLDFGNVVNTLGPIDQVHLPVKQKGTGETPTKECPQCNEMCHAAVRICAICGYEFPKPELDIDKTASNGAVLSTQLKMETRKVSHVMYYRHEKEGKPPTLRVEYLCGFDSMREWISFEGTGRARETACAWWRNRSEFMPPNTIAEAMLRVSELKKPVSIDVRKSGKYYEVMGYDL